jgi:hypothetical protein
MGTKVTQLVAPASTISFPKPMISQTGTVVLFSEPRIGTVIVQGTGTLTSFAEHCDTWNMEHFTDCMDEFIIQACSKE